MMNYFSLTFERFLTVLYWQILLDHFLKGLQLTSQGPSASGMNPLPKHELLSIYLRHFSFSVFYIFGRILLDCFHFPFYWGYNYFVVSLLHGIEWYAIQDVHTSHHETCPELHAPSIMHHATHNMHHAQNIMYQARCSPTTLKVARCLQTIVAVIT